MTNITGKSVRLFLVDGTSQGLMTLEVVNWTGHILTAARSNIVELIKRDEMSRTGVYFLSGPDPEGRTDKTFVYIGESDNVGRRLVEHNKDTDKQFWERAYLITSKDQNLTKAHVKYLESRLIAIADESGQAKILNGNSPVFSKLPEADLADMEYFISQVRLVLPVIGLDILREKPRVSAVVRLPQQQDTADKDIPTFEIRGKKHNITAFGQQIGADFILLTGSETQPIWIGASDHGYKNLQDSLIADKKIIIDAVSNKGIVQEDIVFSSPSAAAAVVVGRSSNGRLEWKVKDTSKTYQDWLEGQIEDAFHERLNHDA